MKNKKDSTISQYKKDAISDAKVAKANSQDDYEIDENIDDEYTSSIFESFKNGDNQNKWFLASGYLSIIFGAICFVCFVFVGIEGLKQLQMQSSYDFDEKRIKFILACVILPIVGFLGIFTGVKIKSFADYDSEKLAENLTSLIFYAILQFLFGGVLTAILTVVGYFVGIGQDYGAIYYSRLEDFPDRQSRLAEAKKMYEQGLIDEEEYQKLKEHILYGNCYCPRKK